jgi:hypothetical protein
MIRIMKRNMRSLVFLVVIAVGAVGFLDMRSFTVPAAARVDNSNQPQTKTKSHTPARGSKTKMPSGCRTRCEKAYSACLVPGVGGIVFVEQCDAAHTHCLKECLL